jgi:hypothetical protein
MDDWRETLRGLLNGYFGDQTIEEGVEELLVVTVPHLDYHERYAEALDRAIEAVSGGDEEVMRIVQESFAAAVEGLDDTREYLEELREEYLTRYQEART